MGGAGVDVALEGVEPGKNDLVLVGGALAKGRHLVDVASPVGVASSRGEAYRSNGGEVS